MRAFTFAAAVLLACVVDGPGQDQLQAATKVAPTMKLCLPSNTTVAYRAKCPTSDTSVKKVCPSGAIVAYSSKCPVAPPPPPPPPVPLAYGGNAVAVTACTSAMNAANATVVGSTYKVVGFWGWGSYTLTLTAGQPSGGVVLNDASHLGDGWNGIFVSADCVRGA